MVGVELENVTNWFEDNVPEAKPPLEFDRVVGGHSCLTFIVTDANGAKYVLRRPPIGGGGRMGTAGRGDPRPRAKGGGGARAGKCRTWLGEHRRGGKPAARVRRGRRRPLVPDFHSPRPQRCQVRPPAPADRPPPR